MMKDVQGFEDEYSITDDGYIFSKKKNKILSSYSHKNWYVNIRLCKNGVQYPFKVHRLVAISFLPNPLNLKDVNHKNGIKHDNRVENLEWCSRSENIKHSYRTLNRTITKGISHPKSKLLIDTSSGIFYDCLREAAIAKNLERNKLKCALRRRSKYNDLSYA